MSTWIAAWMTATVAWAGPAEQTCDWVLDQVETTGSEDRVLEAIALDRTHTWDVAVGDCLRARSARAPVVLAARRRALRDDAAATRTDHAVDPDDPLGTTAFDMAVVTSKRIEITGKGWTDQLLFHPTFVADDLPPWFDLPEFLTLLSQERPGSEVLGRDRADAFEANVPAYEAPRKSGRLGNPDYLTKLADAPLSWITDDHGRVVWLDLDTEGDRVVLSWSMNRLDSGPPFLPVADPERLTFRPVSRDLDAALAIYRKGGKWPAARVATGSTGLAILAAGVGMVAGTFAQYDPTLDTADTIDPSNQRLVTINTAGWATAITGGIVAATGFAIPGKVWRKRRKD